MFRILFNEEQCENCELIVKCEGLGFVYIHRLWPFFLEIGLCSLLSRNCLMYTISFNSLVCIFSVSSSSFLPFLHTAPCKHHTAHFTLHTTHCTLHTDTVHYSLHTAHYTLHTAHSKLQFPSLFPYSQVFFSIAVVIRIKVRGTCIVDFLARFFS